MLIITQTNLCISTLLGRANTLCIVEAVWGGAVVVVEHIVKEVSCVAPIELSIRVTVGDP